MRRPAAAPWHDRTSFFPEIESLRGIAISLVFLLHVSGWVLFPRPLQGIVVSPLRAFASGGHTGVSLFFVLSGFLLGRPFLLEVMQGRRMRRSAYYARRALRILPVYYAAVLVGTVLCAQRPSDLLHGLPYLLFLNAVPGMATPLQPYGDVWWSLAIEVEFYLLLPLLPLVLGSRRGRLVGAVVAVTYIAAYYSFHTGGVHVHTVEGQMKLGHSLFGRAPQFALGIVAAWIYERFGQRIRTWAAATWWVRSGTGDLTLFLLLWSLGELLRRVVLITYWQAEVRWPAWHIAEGLLWSAVMLLLLLVPLWTRVLFCNRMWEAVGRISYSIYLIHAALIALAGPLLRQMWPGFAAGWSWTLGAAALMAVVCLGLSALSYRLIERPFLQRKGRLPWWTAVPAALAAPTDAAPRCVAG